MLHYFSICRKCSTPELPEFREFEEHTEHLQCKHCGNILIKNDEGWAVCGKVGKEVFAGEGEIFLEELND